MRRGSLPLIASITLAACAPASRPKVATAVPERVLPPMPDGRGTPLFVLPPPSNEDDPGEVSHAPPTTFRLVGAVELDGFGAPNVGEVGDRVVFYDGRIRAELRLDGTFAASSEPTNGLVRHEATQERFHTLAGTGTDDVFALFGEPPRRGGGMTGIAYRLENRRWAAVPGYRFGPGDDEGYAELVGFLPWARGTALVIEKHMKTSEEGYLPETRLRWLGRNAPRARNVAFDGHLGRSASGGNAWLVGAKPNAPGLHVMHVAASGATSTELVPGTGECEDLAYVSEQLLVGPNADLTLQVREDEGRCPALKRSSLLERRDGRWQPPVPFPETAQLLAVDARGTRWTAEGGALVATTREGAVTKQKLPAAMGGADAGGPYRQVEDRMRYRKNGEANPEGANHECEGASMFPRGAARVLVRHCMGFLAVFADGATQPVVVVRAPSEDDGTGERAR